MANRWGINTGSYAYASDLGDNSHEGLKALVLSSEIPLRAGSGYRTEPGSWHYSENAIDFFGSSKDMTRCAYYLKQYAPFLGELLYTPPDAKQRSDGRWAPVVAVDNGRVLDSLSDKTAREHGWSNAHVHLAATNSGLRAAAKAQPELLRQWMRDEKARQAGKLPPLNSTVSEEYGKIAPNFSQAGTATGLGALIALCTGSSAVAVLFMSPPVLALINYLVTVL